MSQKSVEIARRACEAYISGNYEATLAAFDPAVAVDWTNRPEGGVYRGRGGVVEAMRTWTRTFEDWRLEIEGILDAGDSFYLVTREVGRGKGSGVPIEQTSHQVVTVRNGKIIHWQGFPSREKALEANGLSE